MDTRPAADEEDDRALVRGYLDGRLDAAEGLIDRYQKRLFNVALRLLDNAQDAEDVTQTVFLNAFLHLRTYDPRFKFFSWVYRMTVNESLNVLKRRQRTVTLEDQPVIPAAEAGDAADRVGQALMKLNPDDRALIVLKHFVFFSYERIAEVLDVPAKTVKSRLFTARERLRLQLHEVP